jgi:hypothetical protein
LAEALFFYINHLHGLAENVGHDQKGEEKMGKVKEIVEFKDGQGILGIEFGIIPYGQKSSGLRRYCNLISESATLEEACVLVLGMPNLANTRPYSHDFHNVFYFLSDLTSSNNREIALCATWAILGSDFYSAFFRYSAYRLSPVFDEFFYEKATPPDEFLLDSAIASIQIFLGQSGPFQEACPRYPDVNVDGLPYRYLSRLIPEVKYDGAVKRFLKSTHDKPNAALALLKFRLFEELVQGKHFCIIPKLEEFICKKTTGEVLTIKKVEAMGAYSGMGHACSAWRRLTAMQEAKIT